MAKKPTKTSKPKSPKSAMMKRPPDRPAPKKKDSDVAKKRGGRKTGKC